MKSPMECNKTKFIDVIIQEVRGEDYMVNWLCPAFLAISSLYARKQGNVFRTGSPFSETTELFKTEV